MNVFFTDRIEGNFAYLDEIESKHLHKVLRKSVGDEVFIIDGKGNAYDTKLISYNRKVTSLKIINKYHDYNKRGYEINIGIAPPKNISRFEWFIEKAIELGIDNIYPIVTQRSHRTKLRNDRLTKIMISASKQAINASLPILHSTIDYLDFVNQHKSESQKFISHVHNLPSNFQYLSSALKPKTSSLVLIGPEGDFTVEELNLAIDFGFDQVSMGNSRLRTETAALYAVLAAQMVNLRKT